MRVSFRRWPSEPEDWERLGAAMRRGDIVEGVAILWWNTEAHRAAVDYTGPGFRRAINDIGTAGALVGIAQQSGRDRG